VHTVVPCLMAAVCSAGVQALRQKKATHLYAGSAASAFHIHHMRLLWSVSAAAAAAFSATLNQEHSATHACSERGHRRCLVNCQHSKIYCGIDMTADMSDQ
jgi:hypothetical protein